MMIMNKISHNTIASFSLQPLLVAVSTFRVNLPLFSTVVPSNICMFLSCRPFVVITTLSTDLVGVEVSSVDNVVITTKGLQDRNIHIFDGTTVENKVN